MTEPCLFSPVQRGLVFRKKKKKEEQNKPKPSSYPLIMLAHKCLCIEQDLAFAHWLSAVKITQNRLVGQESRKCFLKKAKSTKKYVCAVNTLYHIYCQGCLFKAAASCILFVLSTNSSFCTYARLFTKYMKTMELN